jgi:BRCA1-associated protein
MYSITVQQRQGVGAQGMVAQEAFLDTDPESSTNLLAFSAGNPRVEHITGIVHLYKSMAASPSAADEASSSSSKVCVLGLPPEMGFAEFCTWLGESLKDVREIRLVRQEERMRSGVPGLDEMAEDPSSSRLARKGTLVLLDFSSLSDAEQFYDSFNDKPFCLLDPEFVCRLLFVRAVEVLDGAGDVGETAVSGVDREAQRMELPSCPVCLDRLDTSVSGIVTTVCNHRFHNHCLRQWVDSSCPVCRYVQVGHGLDSDRDNSECAHASCHSTVDLWMCLVCGHIGCGRYKGSHAAKHFEETGHGFALELESVERGDHQRVWDYTRDAYVHRLIVDNALDDVSVCEYVDGSDRGRCQDGKEEIRFAPKLSNHRHRVDAGLMQSKVDAVTTELTQLMLSQMETQRTYYENVVESHHRETLKALDKMNASASCATTAAAAADAAAQKAENSMRSIQTKNNELSEKLKTSRKEQSFLRELNETLLSDTKGWRERVNALEKERDGLRGEIEELKEQVNDLMMFIEAKEAIEKGGLGAEAIGGDVGLRGRSRRSGRRR